MRSIGVSKLRTHLSEMLNHVQAGETIEVTKNRRVIALLVPAQRLVDKEQARTTLASLDALRDEIGKHITEPTDVAKLISEMRRY